VLTFTIHIASLRGEGFDLDQDAEYPNRIYFFGFIYFLCFTYRKPAASVHWVRWTIILGAWSWRK